MPQVTVTAANGQIRLESDVPYEVQLNLLAQAIELVRVQVVAKAVADLPPKVAIAPAGSLNGGTHGLRGSDVQFRRGTVG